MNEFESQEDDLAPAKTLLSHDSAMTKTGTVLIVDDDSEIRCLLAESLRLAGLFVVEADGGTEAFTKLLRHPVDVVLSDIHMPNGDGIRLLAAIQEHFPSIPVFLMTGKYGVNRDLCQGAQEILLKPINVSKLLVKLSAALRKV